MHWHTNELFSLRYTATRYNSNSGSNMIYESVHNQKYKQPSPWELHNEVELLQAFKHRTIFNAISVLIIVILFLRGKKRKIHLHWQLSALTVVYGCIGKTEGSQYCSPGQMHQRHSWASQVLWNGICWETLFHWGVCTIAFVRIEANQLFHVLLKVFTNTSKCVYWQLLPHTKFRLLYCPGFIWDRVNFFSVVGTELCFGFSTGTMLITHWCFCLLLSRAYPKSRTLCLMLCQWGSTQKARREHSWDRWSKMAKKIPHYKT